MTGPAPRPLRSEQGYLPIEDHGLIGDGTTAALVGRDGAVSWLCAPRFDSPPLFAGLLDARHGGAFTVTPGAVAGASQRYEPETAVLVTELHGPSGVVEIRDALAVRPGVDLRVEQTPARNELVREVRVVSGQVRLRVDVAPAGGARCDAAADGIRLRTRRGVELYLRASQRLAGPDCELALSAGDRLDLLLGWGEQLPERIPAADLLKATATAWRRWVAHLDYDGVQADAVRRSAITLKLLDYFRSGAIIAAPTSSLPEAIGGPRNWDYRYAWIRDAAFSVYALHRIGLTREADEFLSWVLDVADHPGRPRVLYTIDGYDPPAERQDPELEGYRRSAPVRWGNGAATQRQHDVYGEILDCAYQWARHGNTFEGARWARLCDFAEGAIAEWREPDQGIWEVRTPGRVFTYSAALCQVALDRAARLSRSHGLRGDPDRWERAASRIVDAILEEAWDDDAHALTEHLGGGGLDASLLALPLRRVLPASHPRMAATTTAIAERLGAGDGLVFRYLPHVSPDGLPGHEGAFLLCSFWLVDNLAMQGRQDEAGALFETLCARSGTLGLLPEQIDPSTGAFLGNYPQAFSHVGLISSAVNLSRPPADCG